MNIKEIMQTTPEDLAILQFNTLEKAALDILQEMSIAIQSRNYSKAASMTGYSPSGDGYGCDNSYINFSETSCEDIGEVLERLEQLYKLTQEANKE